MKIHPGTTSKQCNQGPGQPHREWSCLGSLRPCLGEVQTTPCWWRCSLLWHPACSSSAMNFHLHLGWCKKSHSAPERRRRDQKQLHCPQEPHPSCQKKQGTSLCFSCCGPGKGTKDLGFNTRELLALLCPLQGFPAAGHQAELLQLPKALGQLLGTILLLLALLHLLCKQQLQRDTELQQASSAG